MAFGSRSKGSTAAAQNNENTTDPIVVSENEEDDTQEDLNTEATNEVQSQKVTDDKPLLQEVKIIGAAASKNAGGAKVWVCKHCNQKFTSSYTRIHLHFFGGRKGIQRCSALLKDRVKYEMLLNKVKSAEKVGVSRTLKNSVFSKIQTASSSLSKKPIDEAFGKMERHMVDLMIERGLCANGIPFNVLRNPQFLEMVTAISKAPAGYKPPSSEKARTILLDECLRDVEKDLAPIKDTWYCQGVSIVSDGWTNVKHKPLINVLAVNNRGAMFMYAEDFAGVEKTGVAIANYLLGAIDTIGPSNVLQVVTDNAANCKAAGKEIEKVHRHIFWSPCCVHTLNLIFKDLANEFYSKSYYSYGPDEDPPVYLSRSCGFLLS